MKISKDFEAALSIALIIGLLPTFANELQERDYINALISFLVILSLLFFTIKNLKGE